MTVAKEKWSVQRFFQDENRSSRIGRWFGWAKRVVIVCDAVRKSRSGLLGMTDARCIDLVTPNSPSLLRLPRRPPRCKSHEGTAG